MAQTKMQLLIDKAAEQRAQLDAVAAQFAAVRRQRIALEHTEAELKRVIEGFFSIDPTEREYVEGNVFRAEKRPTKRNVAYTLEGINGIIDEAKEHGEVVEFDRLATSRTVYDVDKKLVAQLVKKGAVRPETADNAYTCDWTYSTHVDRIVELPTDDED